MSHDEDPLLAEQVAYYRARAGEYDDFFLRRGRYDRGPEQRAAWDTDVAAVQAALLAAPPTGDVLEIACGTGWWTEQLAPHASSLTALDSSPEVIERNRARVRDPSVEYVVTDVFAWEPPRAYDTVFFGFWLSHVPPDRFERFWALVERCLAPAGRVLFVDNRLYEGYRWPGREPELEDRTEPWVARRELYDGRRFDIVKVFYQPDELLGRLGPLGWTGRVEETETFFVWGDLRRDEG